MPMETAKVSILKVKQAIASRKLVAKDSLGINPRVSTAIREPR